jgi:FdrA protein
LLDDKIRAAGPDDLFIAVLADTCQQAESAIDFATEALTVRGSTRSGSKEAPVHTLRAALKAKPSANLVMISTPGQYVRREALKALDAGLNLFIFSDNVPLEHEIELKEIAQQRGLLVMGPDCGTAIIGGVALGFANAVRRGTIGLVGASGTGLQEVSSLIHQLGHGVSHAIGTGTHDVDAEVGGITMVEGLKRLERDPLTRAIAIVSKPPAPAVLERVIRVVRDCQKPVVVTFLDSDSTVVAQAGAIAAHTLEQAAVTVVARVSGEEETSLMHRLQEPYAMDVARVEAERVGLAEVQRFVRGLFCGGTFAGEATMLLNNWLGTVHSNSRIRGATPLPDPRKSVGHTCVDLGDDIFTIGRPHPMLEPAARRDRLLSEAADPETAVVLADVVIGYGSHVDPAGVLVSQVLEARKLAEAEDRPLVIVAHVCGVDEDPQKRAKQVDTLRAAGILVAPTNVQATALAAAIATGVNVTGAV